MPAVGYLFPQDRSLAPGKPHPLPFPHHIYLPHPLNLPLLKRRGKKKKEGRKPLLNCSLLKMSLRDHSAAGGRLQLHSDDYRNEPSSARGRSNLCGEEEASHASRIATSATPPRNDTHEEVSPLSPSCHYKPSASGGDEASL